MEQDWDEILRERSAEIVDSLLGLGLGLGAYSLTGFAITEMQDVGLALVYFSILFLLTVIFWRGISRSLALARYDDRLFIINFLLGALLVVTPLCLRLMLSAQTQVRELGHDLFPLIMAALSFLGALGQVIVLRQGIAAPRRERMEMLTMTAGFGVYCLVFLLSMRIPADVTVADHLPQVAVRLPAALRQIPARMGAWVAPFLLWAVIEDLLAHVAARFGRTPEQETPDLLASKRALTQKVQAMANSVFAMALGLCAYSLTDFPIAGREDLILALLYFAFTVLVILLFWGELFRAFAAVVYYDDALVWSTICLTYTITLLPFFFRLVLSPDAKVANVGLTAFPICMAAAAVVASSVFFLALRRRTIAIPKNDLMELQRMAFGGPVMAVVFLASLRLPANLTVQARLPELASRIALLPAAYPLRALSWWFAFLAFILVLASAELVMETLSSWQNRPDTGRGEL